VSARPPPLPLPQPAHGRSHRVRSGRTRWLRAMRFHPPERTRRLGKSGGGPGTPSRAVSVSSERPEENFPITPRPRGQLCFAKPNLARPKPWGRVERQGQKPRGRSCPLPPPPARQISAENPSSQRRRHDPAAAVPAGRPLTFGNPGARGICQGGGGKQLGDNRATATGKNSDFEQGFQRRGKVYGREKQQRDTGPSGHAGGSA
jgi:hypothetical protein